MSDLARLCRRIGYEFNDDSLLKTAMRHRSMGSNNNERLEFLGDSVLNFAITCALFEKFPKVGEGMLTQLRATLVNRDSLAEIAKRFSLGEYLKLASSELKSGGHHRESTLADTVEAIIGAIFLDSDIATVQERILAWYEERLANVTIEGFTKDPKTRLQEYLQGYKKDLPYYQVIDVQGHAHDQTFTVECTIKEYDHVTQGKGGSRRRAEREAAETFLEWLENK